MTQRTLKEALQYVSDLCDRGYRSYDPGYYTMIVGVLKEHAEDNERIKGMIRLAEGGHNLTSKRFAYPHIKDQALDLLMVDA